MIEAYEIGITLALDNGVASGVSAIRRDLDALDRAVANSSAGLVALRSVAHGLLSDSLLPTGLLPTHISPSNPAYPAHQPPIPSTIPQTADAPAANNAGTAAPAVILPVLQPTPSRTAWIDPVQSETRLAATPITSTPPTQQPPGQIVTSGSMPVSPPAIPVSTPNNPSVQPAAAKSSAPAETTGTAIFPILPKPPVVNPVLSPLPAFKPAAAAQTISQPPAPKQTANPQHLLRNNASPPTVTPSPSYAPYLTFTSARPPATPQDFKFAPISNQPAAPLAPMHRSTSPHRAETLATQTILPTPAAPAQSRTTGAPHGEIILDSVRLGRWMSDRLARAADRPPSGATGFDPRISPNHAGAPNGS